MPRPGGYWRRDWYGRLQYVWDGKAYDEHRALARARLRHIVGTAPAGDRKQPARQARQFKGFLAGVFPVGYRLVDGHGRTYGKRYSSAFDIPDSARMRVVRRQPEDYHSQLSRMLKRAHKLAVRDGE
ncbi:hypothetical protein [Curvibacter lanceolatus]|uniref:hypothetical protein n=1 Tax=Curvibacter lanceolatus TaxID=86182 RepID=UPI000374AE44|nr:hypothetical protein [Curvibacter lanceolatus]